MTPVQASIWAEAASDTPNDGYTVTYVDVDEESMNKTFDAVLEFTSKYPAGYFNDGR